ncbi:polyphosphate kinase 2 family protein [Parvularcula sp. ZS-1/3]|uniref:Polyphosphate kinase 2 family protein n=1 Tax=Parvularcula mediterranea TaxID=2732508 RepID=A0A7Y3RLZ7_9PROT|nr:PPK2 family polyphosphate kinase [Parvularcula mediterranea]NNU16459.1 polyphosphate kinase 2 family protein [Parvularcula mediterranea]
MGTEQPSFKQVRKRIMAVPGDDFDLRDHPARDETLFELKEDAVASAEADAFAIDELQDRLYAEGKRALLVVLQGMDTAGKSGTIKSVFRATSPMGMTVKAFKKPSSSELARDYLWRVHDAVPPKGFIGIFDRSHYEDVLVARVRKLAPKDAIAERYEQINAFEKLLVETGTTIVKCMLNVSKDEQAERLKARLEKPHKRWKFNPGDLEDRALWPDFMKAYEKAVERCSTTHAPWYIVPSDSKSRRNAIIARLVRGALEDMNPQHPDPGYLPEDFEIS